MNPVVEIIIISIISYTLVGIGLFISKKYIKKESIKDLVFIIVSILTVIIHYTGMIYNMSRTDNYILEDTMFLPVYPCNVMMWINFILCFLIKKKEKVFTVLSEFSFFAGTLCGFIGLSFNINFLNNPNILDYDIFKGLLSHVTLIFSCIYLFVMGYVKVDTLRNLLSCSIGALIFIICGLYSRMMLKLLDREVVNSMFLKAPFENIPFFNFYSISLIGAILLILITTIYEIKFYSKDQIWFNKIKNKKIEEGKEENA